MARTAIVLMAAILAGSCSDNEPANEAKAARASAANSVAQDCPAEQLSCGKQRPVVSDGTTPFRNEDMYLSVVFPAGSQVCMTRSGDAPRGFFAVYGAPPGCPERPERPPRFIVLNASFNALFNERVEEALTSGCAPLSAETRRRLDGAPLTMTGLRTVTCETRGPAGAIEINLNFLGGPWRRVDELRSRRRAVIYSASLGTTPDHFDEDLARFRRVLSSVRIATREPSAPANPPSG